MQRVLIGDSTLQPGRTDAIDPAPVATPAPPPPMRAPLLSGRASSSWEQRRSGLRGSPSARSSSGSTSPTPASPGIWRCCVTPASSPDAATASSASTAPTTTGSDRCCTSLSRSGADRLDRLAALAQEAERQSHRRRRHPCDRSRTRHRLLLLHRHRALDRVGEASKARSTHLGRRCPPDHNAGRPGRHGTIHRTHPRTETRLHLGLGGEKTPVPPGSTTVVIELERDGAGTLLRLIRKGALSWGAPFQAGSSVCTTSGRARV